MRTRTRITTALGATAVAAALSLGAALPANAATAAVAPATPAAVSSAQSVAAPVVLGDVEEGRDTFLIGSGAPGAQVTVTTLLYGTEERSWTTTVDRDGYWELSIGRFTTYLRTFEVQQQLDGALSPITTYRG
ncbi:hypothetical protein LQK89_02130 [Curtobacterium sp. C1]|uniref:hypothetical protein n=1 Tax=Curtobacterium TaxID=2034 RepID=UPI001E61790C|nr:MULTISPECIES: hypothetical protein [Curtobacterium]MCS5485736.1 hypothetical protein [Curtobacterium flaccumfaciens pv. basellae]UFU14517.1 hypothetical protein LQK89_02130 [Curtobacterium sp. C1]WIJ45852.1 hypothetical protein QPK07_02490 [Curtobacterium citreum]